MAASDAQQVTNRATLTGRKVASRPRILLVPVLPAYILALAALPASEAWRRLIVAFLSASGVAILSTSWRYRIMASRSDVASYVGLAASSPQLLSRRSRIALSVRETAARYGHDPAERVRRSLAGGYRALRFIYAFLLVFVLLVNFIGYNWASTPTIVVVMLGGIVGVNVLSKSAAQLGSGAMGSSVDATGVAHMIVPTLTGTPEEYEAWCQAHGVQAYPPGRPEVGQTGQRPEIK
jgi:hypothetical protein